MKLSDISEDQVESDVSKYIRYKSALNGISIDEAARQSMSRLFGHLSSGQKTIVVMTAFRSERTLAQNRMLNRKLANEIRSFGWGYTPVLGGFMETVKDDQGERQIHSHEESFFITTDGPPKEVIDKVSNLLDEYQQEAALLKLPNDTDATLLNADGSTFSVGKWKNDEQQMAVYYTKMKKGVNRQFTFEAAGDDSITSKRAVNIYLESLNK